MKHKKSRIRFTKNQRYGVFILFVLIISVQTLWFFLSNKRSVSAVHSDAAISLQSKIDSLKSIQSANQKPKIYPFNPNFITDYKGYTLGMSSEEIDKLLQYRSDNKWVNSTKEFQNVR